MKPSEAVLKEITHLRGGKFEEFVNALRQDALERLSHADGENFKTIQGEARVYKHLLELIELSRPTLEKMREGKVDMSNAF